MIWLDVFGLVLVLVGVCFATLLFSLLCLLDCDVALFALVVFGMVASIAS